jgi:hypothetical protein
VLYAVNLDGSDVSESTSEEADVYNDRELAGDRRKRDPLLRRGPDGPGSFDSSAAIWSPDGLARVRGQRWPDRKTDAPRTASGSCPPTAAAAPAPERRFRAPFLGVLLARR